MVNIIRSAAMQEISEIKIKRKRFYSFLIHVSLHYAFQNLKILQKAVVL